MRPVLRFLFLTSMILVLVAFPSVNVSAASGEDMGRLERESAYYEKNGLPKSAAEKLRELATLHLSKRNYPAALAAAVKRITLEAALKEDPAADKIDSLSLELSKYAGISQSVGKMVLAEWYWNYLRDNQWRFANRTAVNANDRSTDFRTWDMVSLVKHTEKLFEEAMSAASELRLTNLKAWAPILRNDSPREAVRPTLYDFMAFRVFEFYRSAAQVLPPSEEALVFERDSVAFADSQSFLRSDLKQFPRKDFRVRSLLLFQDLMRFHLYDKDPTAFLDADLLRLKFVDENAAPETAHAVYRQRLKSVVERYPKNATAALAQVALARFLFEEKQYKAALKLAEPIERRFKDFQSGEEANQLVRLVLAKDLSLAADGQIPVGSRDSSVNVSYRNVKYAYFRVYPRDWNKRYFSNDEIVKILGQKAIAEFDSPLKDFGDYASHQVEINLPSLPSGQYVVFVSARKDFVLRDNVVQSGPVSVSNLAMLFEQRSLGIAGRVLNAVTGEPVPGVEVTGWAGDNREKKLAGSIQTDENGCFLFQTSEKTSVTLLAEKAGDRTFSPESLYFYRHGDAAEQRDGRALFFTDRSLYRPGHKVEFKALFFERAYSKDEYRPAINTDVEVELRDANSQLVTMLKLRTNKMGSATGSFLAPAGRLLGGYHLVAVRNFSGSQEFRIEEYKRPKFQVSFSEPTEPLVLSRKARISGMATTYSGVAVANAPVSYQVRRTMRVPWWERLFFWYCFPPETKNEVELARGKTTTDSEGKFFVDFLAAEDKSVAEAKGVVFAFSVHAAVLDDTGEERSADILMNAGLSELQAGFEPADKLGSPFPLKISLATLAGRSVKIGVGEVKIYRLIEPSHVLRSDQRRSLSQEQSDWRLWKSGALAYQTRLVDVDPGSSAASLSPSLAPGSYRAVFSTKDAGGKVVTAEYPFLVLDESSSRFPIRMAQYLALKGARSEADDLVSPFRNLVAVARVGETWEAIWGTGYATGRAYVEIFHRGKLIEAYYTAENVTQTKLAIVIKEEFRGGIHVRVSYVREHRLYSNAISIDVPWDSKELKVEKQVFRSNLRPGQTEQWTMRITGSHAEAVAAEVVATLYDASLDAIFPHSWPLLQGIWPRDSSVEQIVSSFRSAPVSGYGHGFLEKHPVLTNAGNRYPEFASFVGTHGGYWGDAVGGVGVRLKGLQMMGAEARVMENAEVALARPSVTPEAIVQVASVPQPPVVRSNLRETAFFFPQVQTDAKGNVTLNFTMPDALTTWKFMAAGHTKTLQSGLLTATAVTSKELMIEPNLPRFLRSGDKLTLVARVSNTTAMEQSGVGKLRVLDITSRADLSSKFVRETVRAFKLNAKESTTLRWDIAIPDDFIQPLIVEMVAQGKDFSDGEELALPVLSQRVFLTESKAFSLRKPGPNRIVFEALRDSAKRKGVAHAGVTLEYTSNANWYVLQALGYLMEYPFECVEQTFNRLYANALAAHIIVNEPAIAKVFSDWKKAGNQLQSPLEKNPFLKNAASIEMPWLLEAQSETASRVRSALLFDAETMRINTASSLNKLFSMQREDGSWSWYPGGKGDLFMTMYVLAGMGRLEHLDSAFRGLLAPALVAQRERALRWVDSEMTRIHHKALEQDKERKPFLTSLAAQYLYLRSFYSQSPLSSEERKSLDFWRAGAKQQWQGLSLMNQAQVSIAFLRSGENATAKEIVASLRERRLRSEEMGVWWGEYARTGGWWFDAPVETQAMLIELFSELGNAAEFVSDMKSWLVQQKRTQAWHSTKATADAVYALLLRGENPLNQREESALVWGEGKLAHPVNMDEAEKGLGYVKEVLSAEKVSPSQGALQVNKTTNTLGWGTIYWQYFANIGEVKSASSGISIKREVLRINNAGSVSATGAVVGEARVGDTLRVRIAIDSERDYEYVHLKDLRGAGFEPETNLSGYRSRDGLWYYEMPRDTGTSFFIDYLPKGKHVFEYTLKVQHGGEFDVGYAEMQCFYAPEFSARSDGGGLFKVKP
jgi:hypothetical protein